MLKIFGRTSLRTLALLGLAALGASSPARAEFLIGLNTNSQLVTFDSSSPGAVSVLSLSGLQSGETLIGLDRRPANGLLYGIGTTNRVYSIDATTGAATQIGTPGAFTLSGTAFGIDFNPVPDRIRVTSNTGQNLRINPNDGTLSATDTPLAYAGTDPNAAATPNIVGSAYTNSVAGATSTLLYGIDSNLDTLVTQNPPNNGTLNTVGALGFDTGAVTGFDISGATGIAYASLTSPGGTSSQLFTINLATGAASFVGTIGGGAAVGGLTAAVPEPSSLALIGLGGAFALAYRRRRRKA